MGCEGAAAADAVKMCEQARLLASTTSQLQVPPSFDLPLPQGPSSKRRKPHWNEVERTRRTIVAAVEDAALSQEAIDEAMRVLTDGPTATEAVGMVLALDAHLTQEAERLAATGALEAAEAPATPEAAAAAREQVISAVAAAAETPIRSR